MADASVTAIDGRAVVRVGGSELLDVYAGQAIVAAAAAQESQTAAELAAATALAASRYYSTRAAGEAASTTGQLFSTDDGAGVLIYYRRTAGGSVEIGRALTPSLLAGGTGAALIGTATGDTVQGALDARLAQISTRTALAAYGAAYKFAYLLEAGREGVFKWVAGNLTASVTADPAQGIYVAPTSAPTGSGGAWVRQFVGPIYITWFGAKGDGGTNNDSALAGARVHMAARAASGGLNTELLVWPAGRYLYTASENWAIQRLRMHFEGEVWLIRTGTGPAFIMDGGATGPGLLGLQITGYPYINDDGAANHAVYIRAIHSSRFELRSTGAGAGFSVYYCEWLVDNDASFVVSGLEGGIYKVPAYGLRFTSRNANEECSYNRVQVRISGDAVNKIPIGVFLDGALGNKITGTIQNCTMGFRDTTNAWQNVFDKVDWEANTADSEVHGEQTQLVTCDFEKGPVFKGDALDCSMIGGSTVNITVESGALNTLLSSLTYNRRRISGTGAITDAGTGTRKTDVRNGKAGTWDA